MRTIAVTSLKGGCGKTTVAVALAHALSDLYGSALLVDSDPQAHATGALSVDPTNLETHLGHALGTPVLDEREIERLVWPCTRSLSLIPAAFALARAESAASPLAARPDRDRRLAAVLSAVGRNAAFTIIDTPPALGVLTFNALHAADLVVIVADAASPFVVDGVARQVAAVRAVADRAGLRQAVSLVINRTGASGLASIAVGRLEERYGNLLPRSADRVPLTVPECGRLGEAMALGIAPAQHSPGGEAVAAIERIAVALAEATRPALGSEPHIDEPKPAALSLTRVDPMPDLFNGISTPRQPDEASTPDGPPNPAPEPATRAAELAARTRVLSGRIANSGDRLERIPSVGRKLVEASARGPLAARRGRSSAEIEASPVRRGVRATLGARSTASGVLFVAEAPPDGRIAVQGEFDGWSRDGVPLRYNEAEGVHEGVVKAPPGNVRYRLVVNGTPTVDPHNPRTEIHPEAGRVSVIAHRASDVGRPTRHGTGQPTLSAR